MPEPVADSLTRQGDRHHRCGVGDGARERDRAARRSARRWSPRISTRTAPTAVAEQIEASGGAALGARASTSPSKTTSTASSTPPSRASGRCTRCTTTPTPCTPRRAADLARHELGGVGLDDPHVPHEPVPVLSRRAAAHARARQRLDHQRLVGQRLGGQHGSAAYGAAKAGTIALTKYIATQYGKRGIRCNTIVPGWTIGTGWTGDGDVHRRAAHAVRPRPRRRVHAAPRRRPTTSRRSWRSSRPTTLATCRPRRSTSTVACSPTCPGIAGRPTPERRLRSTAMGTVAASEQAQAVHRLLREQRAAAGGSGSLACRSSSPLADRIGDSTTEPAGVTYDDVDGRRRARAVGDARRRRRRGGCSSTSTVGATASARCSSHRKLVGHLAKAAGCRALNVDYRLGARAPASRGAHRRVRRVPLAPRARHRSRATSSWPATRPAAASRSRSW